MYESCSRNRYIKMIKAPICTFCKLRMQEDFFPKRDQKAKAGLEGRLPDLPAPKAPPPAPKAPPPAPKAPPLVPKAPPPTGVLAEIPRGPGSQRTRLVFRGDIARDPSNAPDQ